MERPNTHLRFNRVLVLRAYAMFIDALVTTLMAAPLQWVIFSADEMLLFWLTFAFMNVAMLREFEGTLGMKLLGLVALQNNQRPSSTAVACRLLLTYLPVATGFSLAARFAYSDVLAVLTPALVGLSAGEWLRATMQVGTTPPAPPFWDRLTGIVVIRV